MALTRQGEQGIEWTHIFGPRTGCTWPIWGGCEHGCEWEMPDGQIAVCYAKLIAEGLAQGAYPQGFEHHYFRERNLEDPLRLEKPAGIFIASMADPMGLQVPDEEIYKMLAVVTEAHWHIFFLLTKNAPRLLKFADVFPPNVWVGASMPPSRMYGKPLTGEQQRRMLLRTFDVLERLDERGLTTWMSFEPLSFDVAPILADHGLSLTWAVIGAASRGRETYQPKPEYVSELLGVLAKTRTAVFFKGNLDWRPRREEFPGLGDQALAHVVAGWQQLSMFE